LPKTHLLRLSPVYETDPVGPPQPPYLNMVAELETELSPKGLLAEMLRVEKALGRERRERWGPRTLDLDLLLYGDLVLEEAGLSVPHPRLHERAFVLVPLLDLLPEGRHPLLGQSFAELLASLDASSVRPLCYSGDIAGRSCARRRKVEIEAGSIVEGRVVRVTDFGAFVELPGGEQGLVHISQIAHEFVRNVRDFLNEGDIVQVMVKGRDPRAAWTFPSRT
jgi:2-amino-4-hydroxy-6-hydroxymethyldihydropteridine diphosphokinase